MAAGLQIFNESGALVFDSSVNTLVTLIRNSRRTFTRFSGLTFRTLLSDIPNPSMRNLYIQTFDSTNYYGVEASYIDANGYLVVTLGYALPSTQSLDLNVKIYRC